MNVQDAARARTQYTRKVMVRSTFDLRAHPKHRVLMWDGERPYVVIGTCQARHREYLTSFESFYNGALVIFTSNREAA